VGRIEENAHSGASRFRTKPILVSGELFRNNNGLEASKITAWSQTALE